MNKLLLRLLIIFAIFAVITGIFPTVLHLPELELRYIFSHAQKEQHFLLQPRFWVQGQL